MAAKPDGGTTKTLAGSCKRKASGKISAIEKERFRYSTTGINERCWVIRKF